jgi:hypothetical protein
MKTRWGELLTANKETPHNLPPKQLKSSGIICTYKNKHFAGQRKDCVFLRL